LPPLDVGSQPMMAAVPTAQNRMTAIAAAISRGCCLSLVAGVGCVSMAFLSGIGVDGALLQTPESGLDIVLGNNTRFRASPYILAQGGPVR
jgi:hypothetical protein